MKKLVAYITSSFPENSFTIDLSMSLKEAGVDTLELGIPFSDPVADGAIIESANFRALKNGFKVNDLFEVSETIAKEINTLWMGYMNPFYHYGMKNFFTKAKQLGVKGVIIPDLPYEEATAYTDMAKKYEQSIVSFVAPTHNEERIKKIVANSKEFIYLVAYAGITGSSKSEDLSTVIENIKKYSKTPVYIGFGVDEKTCKEKIKGVDGVIVGSAFVKHMIDDSLSYSEKIQIISSKAKEIKLKINE